MLALAAAAPAQGLGIQLTTGVDGGVDVPADPLLVPATGLTVEAWITYDDATVPTGLNYWPTIARQNIANNAEVWNLRVNASTGGFRSLAFIVRVNGALQTVAYNFAVGEFVQFTHVAATYDGRTMRLYKNGAQVATRTLTTTAALVYNQGTTRIGNGDPVNPGFESWNGVIDEFRVWPMARTAAEITATMNESLAGLPGGCVTFPLDGFLIDTSNGIIGTQFGTMAYVPGAPAVLLVNSSQANLGTDSTTCQTAIRALIGSVAAVGNADFAVWAVGGPRPGASPLGLVVAAAAAAPPGQPQFAGVDLAFDIGSVLAQTTTPAADPLGGTRLPLPIPAVANLAGTTLICQYGYADAVCGPQGFSASDGVRFTVQ